MKILVLGGGNSAEREVSLRSATAVRESLERLGIEVGYLDPKGGMDAVTEKAREYDLILPILHGEGGEDGEVQKALEKAGVPYLGAGVAASELCFDKARLKELLRANDILTPASELVNAESFEESGLIKRPFVLKTTGGGSSVDMMLVRNLPYDKARASELLARHKQMLLEELIEGVEITIPILGDNALPVIEIVPPAGGEFDYENKYNGATQELCPPRNVDVDTQVRAQRLAERIHALAGVKHMSRTDMIVSPKGLYVLEVNTLPGMTAQSLFPKGAAAAGLTFDKLVGRLVELSSAVKSG